MNADDLREVVNYFRAEGRDPYETELRILDTYWSDHCRHTTFTTVLTSIRVDESFMRAELEESLELYHKIRRELGRDEKPLCLMDLATIGARYLRKIGKLDDLEVSEENNACSIFVDVDVDGQPEKWLLQFKNETHNHPTEIEPFGGASTCLGGAIRDPLSGRSYVYQAMRVTGAGDIYQPVGGARSPANCPQRVISRKAAAGYSSYGNQIGLATTHVREIYHPDYVAKRLEVGAVVGAVKAENVRRETPAAGDVVLLLGGRTGRDGIGGATGSSKEHNTKSLETCSSEVQKGNAPEERKLERLFRRPEVTRLIKKSNDFGAGGVSVAIGELTDGLDIYLDRVPTKYDGLNATELAISESQERMAVVVERADMERFMDYCREENIEVTHVADVTDTRRMRMYNRDRLVVDLSREFIDSAGAAHYAEVEIGAVEACDPFVRKPQGATLAERMEADLADDNVVSQKGLVEMFDSTIGRFDRAAALRRPHRRAPRRRSRCRNSPSRDTPRRRASWPTATTPSLASWSPYHGAAYAVVEACAEGSGRRCGVRGMRFSYQEYFERMHTESRFVGQAAGGAAGCAADAGRAGAAVDRRQGLDERHLPADQRAAHAHGLRHYDRRRAARDLDRSERGGAYALPAQTYAEGEPYARYRGSFEPCENYASSERIAAGRDPSAGYAVGFGGVAEALAKMAFGNGIGAEVELPEEAKLFAYDYGSIVVESTVELDAPFAVRLGRTTADEALTVNGERMPLDTLRRANSERFAPNLSRPRRGTAERSWRCAPAPATFVYGGEAVEHPVAYLPGLPRHELRLRHGASAFRRAGAEVETSGLLQPFGRRRSSARSAR
ncbi:MAG: AIR synthase-related protein [Alistipes shahii]